MISAGVSVPVQIPSHTTELGTSYWPRLQWSTLFGLHPPSHTLIGTPGIAALPAVLRNDCDDKIGNHNIHENDEQLEPEGSLHPIPPI